MLLEGRKDPGVYVYRINPDWSQVILCNNDDSAHPVTAPISGNQADTGSLGHDANSSYYLYDFWNDKYLGEWKGSQSISRPLKSHQALTYSLHRKKDHPQFLSTNRHIMQGLLDLAEVKWDANTMTYSGVAKVVGGEPFVITLANNKHLSAGVKASTGKVDITKAENDLSRLTLTSDKNADVKWSVTWTTPPAK